MTEPRPTPPMPTDPARYSAPPTPQALAARLGMPLHAICKLDGNESPFGPPPHARAAFAQLADPACELDGIGRYPDPYATRLRERLADYTGVPAEQIVVGNGSDELIHLLCQSLLSSDDEVITCEPTFSVYALAARAHGGVVRNVAPDAGFDVPADALTEAITPATRLVFLCSPNNPTGALIPREVIEAALARIMALRAAGSDALLVLDEAYYEFGALADVPGWWSAAAEVARGAPLIVLRTFSKLFALAGLRVGYALCPSEVAARLQALRQPYNVSLTGQVVATAALDDLDWLRERACILLTEREQLVRALQALPGLRVYPSAANFVLVELVGASAEENVQRRDVLWQALLERGILVRKLAGERLAATLRISVGRPEENTRLLAALGELLEGTEQAPRTRDAQEVGASVEGSSGTTKEEAHHE